MPIYRNRLLKISSSDILSWENNLNLQIGKEMNIMPYGKKCDSVTLSLLMIRFQNLTLLIQV